MQSGALLRANLATPVAKEPEEKVSDRSSTSFLDCPRARVSVAHDFQYVCLLARTDQPAERFPSPSESVIRCTKRFRGPTSQRPQDDLIWF